jgi:hypothetical protein
MHEIACSWPFRRLIGRIGFRTSQIIIADSSSDDPEIKSLDPSRV